MVHARWWLLGFRYLIMDAEYSVIHAWHWMPDTGYWRLIICYTDTVSVVDGTYVQICRGQCVICSHPFMLFGSVLDGTCCLKNGQIEIHMFTLDNVKSKVALFSLHQCAFIYVFLCPLCFITLFIYSPVFWHSILRFYFLINPTWWFVFPCCSPYCSVQWIFIFFQAI